MHKIPSTIEQRSDAEDPAVETAHQADLPGCESCVVTEELVRKSSALFTILNNEGCIDACPRLKKLREELAA